MVDAQAGDASVAQEPEHEPVASWNTRGSSMRIAASAFTSRSAVVDLLAGDAARSEPVGLALEEHPRQIEAHAGRPCAPFRMARAI